MIKAYKKITDGQIFCEECFVKVISPVFWTRVIPKRNTFCDNCGNSFDITRKNLYRREMAKALRDMLYLKLDETEVQKMIALGRRASAANEAYLLDNDEWFKEESSDFEPSKRNKKLVELAKDYASRLKKYYQ